MILEIAILPRSDSDRDPARDVVSPRPNSRMGPRTENPDVKLDQAITGKTPETRRGLGRPLQGQCIFAWRLTR